MSRQYKVAVLVGSLRAGAYSGHLAKAIADVAPENLSFETIGIGDLPFYNPDLDGDDAPAAWVAFRAAMKGVDAVLFVTPEYNRSVPAALKNALDVGSRPYGASIWDGLPGAVVSVSPGAISGFGANHHLRQSLVFLNVLTVQQPEAYIGNAAALFDADGALINDGTKGFLTKFAGVFANWIATIRGA